LGRCAANVAPRRCGGPYITVVDSDAPLDPATPVDLVSRAARRDDGSAPFDVFAELAWVAVCAPLDVPRARNVAALCHPGCLEFFELCDHAGMIGCHGRDAHRHLPRRRSAASSVVAAVGGRSPVGGGPRTVSSSGLAVVAGLGWPDRVTRSAGSGVSGLPASPGHAPLQVPLRETCDRTAALRRPRCPQPSRPSPVFRHHRSAELMMRVGVTPAPRQQSGRGRTVTRLCTLPIWLGHIAPRCDRTTRLRSRR
jgi:hypothetical protein